MPRISIIAAISKNHVIGKQGGLPWHLPDDLKWFKRKTSGHPIIMGRKTYESVGKPLPNRLNIIITRQDNYKVEGATVVNDLATAIEHARKNDASGEIFIVGGGEIYNMAMHIADRMYITIVHTTVEGDAYFPRYDESDFDIVESVRVEEPIAHTFMTLDRKQSI